MDIKQLQKIEKLAADSLTNARLALRQSEQLQSVLSLLEYKRGQKKVYVSVDALFTKLKLA